MVNITRLKDSKGLPIISICIILEEFNLYVFCKRNFVTFDIMLLSWSTTLLSIFSTNIRISWPPDAGQAWWLMLVIFKSPVGPFVLLTTLEETGSHSLVNLLSWLFEYAWKPKQTWCVLTSLAWFCEMFLIISKSQFSIDRFSSHSLCAFSFLKISTVGMENYEVILLLLMIFITIVVCFFCLNDSEALKTVREFIDCN